MVAVQLETLTDWPQKSVTPDRITDTENVRSHRSYVLVCNFGLAYFDGDKLSFLRQQMQKLLRKVDIYNEYFSFRLWFELSSLT